MAIKGAVACFAAGLVVACLGSPKLLAARGDDRTIVFYNIHTKETTSVHYKKNGTYIPAGLERLNWALRDWRRDEATKMDPALIDLLWDIHAELGSKEPIHVISAFRSRTTNAMLRSTVGGQASESRHMVGKAIDVHFPDVPVKKIRYSALIREQGGVGYYPTSALPFVHVDTDRVRHWPRMPRHELALLFPAGNSQHQPAEGGSISADDVRQAKSRHRDMAIEMAAYHDLRREPRSPVIAVAQAEPTTKLPPRPQQIAAAEIKMTEPPRIVDRASMLVPRPSVAGLIQPSGALTLAALPPDRPNPRAAAEVDRVPTLIGAPQPVSRGWGRLSPSGLSLLALDGPTPQLTEPLRSFAIAPAFDEEHPDELAYRPFPIAPFLTATASIDDPALAMMKHPDVQKTLDLLDAAGSMPPMKLRPTERVAALMLAQSFRGDAVNIHKAFSDPDEPAGTALVGRTVSTQ